MAKVVLLRIPGFHNDFRIEYPIPNLGVGFLAAIAKEEGHEAVVLEGHMWIDSGYLPINLNYRERIDFFLKEVEEESPDILGISVLSGDLALGIEFAKTYRAKHPKTFILMGGTGVNGVVNIVVRYAGKSLDIIVKGEGEDTFQEILKELKKGKPRDFSQIKGISYRNGKKWTHNPLRPLIQNLNTLPLVTLENYKYLPQNIITLLPVERGCSSGCRFCFATETWGNGRYFSTERIKEQGKILLQFQKTVKVLLLSDSNILAHEKIGEKTLFSIMKNFPEAVGSVNLRVDQITPSLIEIFSRFPKINPLMGIEALSPHLLSYLGKTPNPQKYLEKVREILPLIGKNRVHYCLSLIYHIPGETKEDLKIIHDFFLEQDREMCVFIYFSRLWLEGNTALWRSYERGELDIYPAHKLQSAELGEQYNDVVFEPMAFLFKNPLITDSEYGKFVQSLRGYFKKNTNCFFFG